jgi:hypothetical protein
VVLNNKHCEKRKQQVERFKQRAGVGFEGALLEIFMSNVYGHDSNWRHVVCCLFVDE